MNTLALLILLLVVLFLASNNKNNVEEFNRDTGTYCSSCYNKTLNSCNNCFNCGVLQDKFGNQWCVEGDVNGPYNRRDVYGSKWKFIDPFSYLLQRQKRKRRCSDGPSNATRALGLRGL
jgi:hypothetical protein